MKNLIELARECGGTVSLDNSWDVIIFGPAELQAFANAILEEAAKKCDEKEYSEVKRRHIFANETQQDCAAAIRAMKEE